jgi:hypothetical protein
MSLKNRARGKLEDQFRIENIYSLHDVMICMFVWAQQQNEFYTGRCVMFSLITNIYSKKTKGPTLMELFTATGKLNFF